VSAEIEHEQIVAEIGAIRARLPLRDEVLDRREDVVAGGAKSLDVGIPRRKRASVLFRLRGRGSSECGLSGRLVSARPMP